jgi:hypothetical protein
MENREPIINNHINQITLDFLMNQSQYKKYVAKNDPTKHIENEEHLQKICKYKHRISNITNDLLDNPETMITLDVSQSFDRYVRTLIRYFEMKDLENKDDDVLFDYDMDNDNDADYFREESDKKMAILQKVDEFIREPEHSYWGKNIVKKTQTSADFFLRNRKYKSFQDDDI